MNVHKSENLVPTYDVINGFRTSVVLCSQVSFDRLMMAPEVHLNVFLNNVYIYFLFITKISSRTAKIVCVGSQIFQAWRKFMDEIEQQSKLIRSNAEQLENLCSERMAQLYQDKRKSRKQYQEEHAKIASQFGHVS